MPRSSYLTIARDGDAEIEVKRSRFLCWLRRVEDEEQAREVVEQARKEHWQARHHCSAFVVGPDGDRQRSSDDGEPAGTAGAPMLEVLRGREVSDVVAVVIRYFGGRLLGAGGLVRAYSDAVRVTLDEVGLVRRQLMQLVDVRVGHADVGRLENDLRSQGMTVRGVEYAEQATIRVAVQVDAVPDFHATIAQMIGGAPSTHEVGTDWVDVADGVGN